MNTTQVQAIEQPTKVGKPMSKASKASKAAPKAAPKAKKVSSERTAYQSMVLDVNKALKEEKSSLGHCVTYLLTFADAIKLQPKQVAILKAAKKDLKPLAAYCKPNAKSGKFSPFYCLQGVYRMLNA